MRRSLFHHLDIDLPDIHLFVELRRKLGLLQQLGIGGRRHADE